MNWLEVVFVLFCLANGLMGGVTNWLVVLSLGEGGDESGYGADAMVLYV